MTKDQRLEGLLDRMENKDVQVLVQRVLFVPSEIVNAWAKELKRVIDEKT